MTMPNERSRAVLGAGEILRELLDREKHPETTEETRRHIIWALRHYPGRSEINAVSRDSPDYFEYVDDEEARKQGLIPAKSFAKSLAEIPDAGLDEDFSR